MLIVTGKKNEQLVIRLAGQTVVVRILDVVQGRVRVGVTARRSAADLREELVLGRRGHLPRASEEDE
jgi:sRNA-binding carbon storage regulator CsrA